MMSGLSRLWIPHWSRCASRFRIGKLRMTGHPGARDVWLWGDQRVAEFSQTASR